MKNNKEVFFALIPLILFCGYFAYKAIGFPLHDFANYYFGGWFLAHGKFTTDIYFPSWFNHQIAAIGYSNIFSAYGPNTPFLALLFSPLTYLSAPTAKLLFNISGVILFLYSIVRVVFYFRIKPYYLILIPLLFFIPLQNCLLFGQVYLLLFFLLAESWLAYEKGNLIKMSIFLGIAILLKVFPVLLAAVFLFRKEYKALLYVGISSFVLLLLSAASCGIEVWTFYLTSVLPKASNGAIASAFEPNYQSIFMFLKQLMVFDVTENPHGLFSMPLLFSAFIIGYKTAVIIIGFYATRKISDSLLVISYWILAMILISPYGSTYTYILMLFPFLALAKAEMTNVKKGVLMLLLFLVNNFPISLFMEKPFPFSYLRLYAFLLFCIIFLTVVHKYVNWKLLLLTALSSICVFYFLKPEVTVGSSYFLSKNSPILIYDYKIDNHELIYSYWNEHGKNTRSIPIKIESQVDADLSENSIYLFGKRINSDNGNKLKPILINGKSMLYLSDYDRGIGFYTLRKLDLR